MRVNNQSIDTVAANTSTGSAQKTSQQTSQIGGNSSSLAGSDQASLSSASNLIALAKSATSSDRQAKLSALSQQVQSGSYHGDTALAGKAMVKELLQTSASASS